MLQGFLFTYGFFGVISWFVFSMVSFIKMIVTWDVEGYFLKKEIKRWALFTFFGWVGPILPVLYYRKRIWCFIKDFYRALKGAK
jgi:hypothetical protein